MNPYWIHLSRLFQTRLSTCIHAGFGCWFQTCLLQADAALPVEAPQLDCLTGSGGSCKFALFTMYVQTIQGDEGE